MWKFKLASHATAPILYQHVSLSAINVEYHSLKWVY